jgi:TRAP-type C4-dicarboxylate transport system permease small subunit
VRLIRALDRWLEPTVLVLLGSVLVLSLTYTTIVRYFAPLPALTALSHRAEELAIFTFVWLLYWGSVLATREGGHFRVTAHFALLPKRLQRWQHVPGDIVWLAFNGVVIWQGMKLVQSALDNPERSLALNIPMQYVYVIIPLAFLLTCVRLIQSYLSGARGASRAPPGLPRHE